MIETDTPPDSPSGAVLTDAVTGALSRAFFEVRLREELSRSARSGADCSMCLFDVDHFKSINDAFGHVRGDQVLRQVVERITDLLRGSDAVFRYGGDEFVLLLPEAGRLQAAEVAQRVVDGVGTATFAGDPPLQVGISLGVACYPEDGVDPHGLVAAADRRSYLAKQRGRGCVVSDDAATEVGAASSRLLERDTAMTFVQGFLAALPGQESGVLRVGGERGSGHSRVLDEIAKIADLRGFEVIRLAGQRSRVDALAVPIAARRSDLDGGRMGVLILADGEASWDAACRLARARVDDGSAAAVGLVLASPGPSVGPVDADLPLRAVVELAPWSATAMAVWLRTRLRGEPSPALVDFVRERSGGLPARAERALNRLTSSNSLERTSSGWTLSRHAARQAAQPGQNRLPAPSTELVGRGCEIDQIIELLARERLVTLVGPGGIGKTRLSLAVATAIADRFDDGAVFVPLADETTSDQVDSAVAQALHIAETAGQRLADAVAEHLASRQLLLVLDNFEQVVTAAVRVADWLAAAPGLTVLVSSRERLQLSAEQVYAVPGLSLPPLDRLPHQPDEVALTVARSSALYLFNARARRVDYAFALTAQNLPAVAELCHRLDGLPLAIELAASRVDTMAPEELLRRLSGRLDLPDDGPVDLTARQQTLRGAIGWSYDLLDEADRTLFVALGGFAGGCRLEAIATVSPTSRLAERVAGLVEKNLVKVWADPDGETRFIMLETIRAYAGERLAANPCADDVHSRHAAHFATFAEQVVPHLLGPEQSVSLDLIAREQHNLRAALTWALGRRDFETAARIGVGIWRFWDTRGQGSEGREWINQVLEGKDDLPPELIAGLSYGGGAMAADQGDIRGAAAFLEQSLRYARTIDDSHVLMLALHLLGRMRSIAGEHEQARELHEEGLALARAASDVRGVAAALGGLGAMSVQTGNLKEARALLTESLELIRPTGHTLAILTCVGDLGELLLIESNTAEARPLLEESLTLSRENGDASGEAWSMHLLGIAADLDGAQAESVRLLTGALSLRHDIQANQGIADSLEGLAGVAADTDAALAARMLGAADELRESRRLPRPKPWQRRWAASVTLLQEKLDQTAYNAAWSAGRDAPLDEVVAEALRLNGALASA